jgi:hypothetical protein
MRMTPVRMSDRLVRPVLAVVLSLVLLAPAAARAERVNLDKPVRVTAAKADKSKLVGRVTAWDETSFELVKGADAKVEVKWSELDAANVYLVRSALLTAKPDAQGWIRLGRDLRGMAGGEKLAEASFGRALKIDPKLKDAVEAARKEPVRPATPAGATGGADDTTMKGPAGASDPGAGSGGPAGGPKVIGLSTEKTWKVLTDDEQAAAVKALDEFAAETRRTMSVELLRQETRFFLFYSDLGAKEAKKWADLLDKMYAKLSDLFATGKGVNVWRGKALVFVFAKEPDYHRFQRLMHKTDSGGSAGMCHSFGNGDVHIAFYRQPEELTFAHVLVHESVHGFLHRFKTPVNIPSWVNEGLAETIATELVPRPARGNEVKGYARRGMEQNGKSLGGMLETDRIDGWQYPVAESLTAFMIQQNKKGYVNFVMGIKDGLTWQEALAQKYKAPRDRLVAAFGEFMQVKGLKE